MDWNWLQKFSSSPKDKEDQETRRLFDSVVEAQRASPLSDESARDQFVINMVYEACQEKGVTAGSSLALSMFNVIHELLYLEGFVFEIPDTTEITKLSLAEGVALRDTLQKQLRFIKEHNRLLPMWREKLVIVFSGILEHLPLSAFADIDEDAGNVDNALVLPEAKLFDLADRYPQVVHKLLGSFSDQVSVRENLFGDLRESIEDNILQASGLRQDKWDGDFRKLRLPEDQKEQSPDFLTEAYLRGTPFREFFKSGLPFAIPFPARFEHTHIVGGTGHGKTQLIQFLINHDLLRSKEDGRSVIVIDSQGDLIRTISHLKYFGCDEDKSLAERFVLVDPNDVENPVCLNMFDWGSERCSGYAPVDREKIYNATVELYEYFFGALLGAELTQRQGLLFRYLARLLMEIPSATIHTLRALMEDGERFLPYMEKLGGTARSFFATQFFDRKFTETKKQILTRLWGVLSNASLERMFSHTKNKIDMFQLMNEGKIILINTAKDLLGQEGASIFGRFFIALIAQAAIQRATLLPHERNSTFVYVDEAQDYFDSNISQLLNQARKYRVGLIFAHQNLDQLDGDLRSSVLASTTIKFAGGLSAKDAGVLSSEFRDEATFLLAQEKDKRHTEFACYVKNFTTSALSISIPLGYVDALPKLSNSEYSALIDKNRRMYSESPMAVEDIEFPKMRVQKVASKKESVVAVKQSEAEVSIDIEEAPEAATLNVERVTPLPTSALRVAEKSKQGGPKDEATKEPGRGGRKHKYLQQLVKHLGEDRGFRASIEETILKGAGRVDVSLVRDALKIACQISVTTSKDWELGGIEKCIAAGYTDVVLIGATDRHVKTLSKFIEENLDEKDQGKVTYLTSETIVAYLDKFGVGEKSERVVRGYKVRTVHQSIDVDDAYARRRAISEVIARSLKKSKDG